MEEYLIISAKDGLYKTHEHFLTRKSAEEHLLRRVKNDPTTKYMLARIVSRVDVKIETKLKTLD